MVECRALWIEYRARLTECRARFTEHRALLIQYRALLIEYTARLTECRVVCVPICRYGVATISRLLQITGLFCRMLSLLQGFLAKETCNFKEPTRHSHPIAIARCSLPRRTVIWDPVHESNVGLFC